jgi:alpha-1,3/alpha-1,6-mannosyltransferase
MPDKNTAQPLPVALRVAFLHPDLGLGGAERLIVDAATELAAAGHDVDVWTAYYDPHRCFDETRTGGFRVRVAGGWFPRAVGGRAVALCAFVRCVLAAISLAWVSWREGKRRPNLRAEPSRARPPPPELVPSVKGSSSHESQHSSGSVAVTSTADSGGSRGGRGGRRWSKGVSKGLVGYDVIIVDQVSVAVPVLLLLTRARVLFYCHFPDLLLSSGGDRSKAKIGWLKRVYR